MAALRLLELKLGTLAQDHLQMVRKQVANEIVSREQSQLWLESTRTLRARVGDLERENRSFRAENNTFKAYLEDLGVDTAELSKIAKEKRSAKAKKGKKKIVRAGDHDSSSSETQDSDTAESDTAMEN
ncbi:hypothetical protein G7Y79_00060g092460 [Physcia stellaris]|nr:hypothetical protein G7Y79_00060g092460 [Physcia stellaris]